MHDEAIRTFLLHDHGRVVRAVAAVCGDRGRAEDAVQDALVDVWTKDQRVDDLTGWVATAAINRARSRWRTQAAERRAFDRLATQAAVQPEAHPVDGSVSPVLFDAHLAQALRDLPRSQRSVVALHYLLDMSVADVAAHLGVAEGTVKTHLHRARETMRTALGTSSEPDLKLTAGRFVMRDIDNDIRNSLERLTNPQVNTPGTEALWGDLVARRRKRRNRNRTLVALPLLLVAVIAVGILSTRDSTDSTRTDVAAGGADVSTPTVDDVQGSWGLRALIRNGEEHLTSNEAVLVIDGDEAVGDDGCGNDIRTRLQDDKVTAPGFHSLGGCIDPDINDDANHLWHVLENEPTYKLRDGDLWLVTGTGDGLVLARRDAPEEPTTGTLRVRNIQVFGNGPSDGGTERAVIVFNEAIPIEEVQYVHDIDAAAPGTGMAWTTQGPNSTHLCESQHSVPDGAVGSVDLLVPASWFVDADAHTVTELATIDNPAKFPICGPHNGFIQYAMWSPLSADSADVTVNVSSDRTTVTIEVAPEGDVPLDPVAGQAVVADFLDRLRDDNVEGAAALWTGYPASQPDRPVSERVHYVELLAEYPPFARILDSDTTTTFVTPSLDNENAQVVTILDARSPNSPPVAVAFLTELHDEDGDERMWIQRLPPIDANATPELPNDGYVQPGERVVVPGLPVEGSVRGFVNGDEVPVEADLENETFTVIVPPEASGDIAVTFVVATPEEPIVRTFAATVR